MSKVTAVFYIRVGEPGVGQSTHKLWKVVPELERPSRTEPSVSYRAPSNPSQKRQPDKSSVQAESEGTLLCLKAALKVG